MPELAVFQQQETGLVQVSSPTILEDQPQGSTWRQVFLQCLCNLWHP